MSHKPITEIDGGEELLSRIAEAETVEDWSFILGDYLSFGNSKIDKKVGIFNMNAASDCPNRESDNCQVPWEDCYAGRAERQYPQPLAYRRRQEYLWDCMPPGLWADAFLQVVERKRNPVDYVRFSEAGDFRHNGDIARVDAIARRLTDHDITVYTYSASDYLDWSIAEHFTVNASNPWFDNANRRYKAVDAGSELDDGEVWCPYDYSDGDKKCGECTLCIEPDGPDVAIPLH
jgi:hypothetical protein